MGNLSLSLILSGVTLATIQFLAALPWLIALDPVAARNSAKRTSFWGFVAGGIGLAGVALAMFIGYKSEATTLEFYGRFYGAILHAQLAIDLVIGLLAGLLLISPKTGAVALAAFREAVRQPLFWSIAAIGVLFLALSVVLPYFTFGEDYLFMKQLGFDVAMLGAAIYALLTAAFSINEEIENRVAITVISKPINRRQFILGKYFGFLFAALALTLILGWFLGWALYLKSTNLFDKLDDVKDAMPLSLAESFTPFFEALVKAASAKSFVAGTANWFGETAAHSLGLIVGFGQVMVLLAICVSLATRVSYVVNLTICFAIFVLGHLAPVLVSFTQKFDQGVFVLIRFIAQLFDAVLPSLEYFNMAPAIIRDSDLPLAGFAVYVASVFGYALLYSSIALVVGLFLFEDKDLS